LLLPSPLPELLPSVELLSRLIRGIWAADGGGGAGAGCW
jgi:hypothetical protein